MKTLVRFLPVNIGLNSFIPFAAAFRPIRLCLAGCLLINAAQVVRAQQNTPPAVSLALTTVNTGKFEIELHAAPATALGLEASSDLKNWSDYPMPDALAQIGTNGVCRLLIIPSGENQFFRAKQMP